MILDQAFRYITELKKQNDAMLLEGGDKTQAEEIRHLRCQLEELRKESAHYMELLKAHDLLEDPSIHWKGKQRCPKTVNVTQASQIQKGIIVYSSGNLCSTGKDLGSGTQPSETVVLQQPPEVSARLRVNGALLQVNTPSSTPSLVPGSALAAPQSTPAVRVIEQCVVETPAVAPSLTPSVSYITLQIPTVTTALPPQPLAVAPVQALTVPTTSTSPLLSESAVVPVSSLSSLNHIITPPRPAASDAQSLTSTDNSTRTVSYTAVAQSLPPLRAQAAGSTQTTWTTLQMAGNTVQPVCQNLPTPSDSTATQSIQRVTVCQPIQVQPAVPAPQTPITGPIQSQLRTAILSPRQSVGPQNSSAILGQSDFLPQPSVVSQPQPTVLQSASLVAHPPLIPQPQSTVLPLLQTMQVLQVKTANPTAPGVSAAQSTNNPSVVILQQANTCPTQTVVREEIPNQTPCQHIVIIQAPNQSAHASQNPPVSVLPAVVPPVPPVPSVPASMPTTSAPAVSSPQTVGGKQLVHILPRPVQPQNSKCQPVTPPTTSTSAAVTPQTITVNGQVFALQPVKTTDNLISNGGQTTLQLVQPTTTEEPTTNVALNSLGALSSLNQSISQGIPLAISNQNSLSLPSPIIQQQPPSVPGVSDSTVALPVQVPCLKSFKPAFVVKHPKTPGRKSSTPTPVKKSTAKKIKQVKSKEQKSKQPAVILAKTAITDESQIMSNVSTSSAAEITQTSSNTVVVTTACSQSLSHSVNVTVVQDTDKNNTTSTSDAIVVSSQSDFPSIDSATAQTNNSLNIPNTSVVTIVSDITSRPLGSSATLNEIKATKVSENALCKAPEVKLQKESCTIEKKTSEPAVSDKDSSDAIETRLQTVCTNSTSTATASLKTTQSSPVCQAQGSHIQEPRPCSRSGSTTSSAVCTTNSDLSSYSSEPNSTIVTSFGTRTVLPDASTVQKTNMNSLCTPRTSPSEGQSEALEKKQNKAIERLNPVTDNSEIASKKDFALNQQIYTNLDDQTSESSLSLSRQTESPTSTVTGGRGFSVASMLPQGQSMSAASGSLSSFILTSEQADMLALAMLEQDSPDRKSGGCSENKTALSNSSTGTWEPTKPPVSTTKDCVSTAQQGKFHKTLDALKAAMTPSVRGQISEANISGLSGSRHPQNLSYSHSQSAPQPQNTSQSSTVASLSVNNLIRTNSSQQPYSGSPVLMGQASVPSPVCTTAHISQPPNNALSPCSASSQHEYTPLKTALLRSQPGLNMGERQVKMIPKRQAQEEVIVNSGKRAKPCVPSANTVTQMETKGPDHSQLMGAQLPPISSAVMTRISNDSGGPLFSSNSFVSPLVRPSEAHCPLPGPPEQNQPGVLHLPQGHLQHAAPQTGPNLGGNPYMKQQQEQQRQHLYHLQQHLTQSDPAQRHSLHQRALQQQEQQQHAQKKRGLVRGSQTTSPAALQQKQQSHPPSQQSHQPTPQQHPQPSHPQQAQNQPHPQQLQQSSHSRHQQHLQQQLHQQQHFRHQDKSCEAPRTHHSSHLTQQDHHKPGQDHNAMQRMMSSRNLEQTLISAPSNPVSRSSDLVCAPSRQERHRVTNYSAEALIGKSSTSDQRMSLHLQPGRGSTQEQPDLRGYLDTSRTKANITIHITQSTSHNPQNRIPPDHPGPTDGQRVSECSSFKGMGAPHPLGGFEVPVSRGNEMTTKSGPTTQRGPQGQQPGGFRMAVGPQADGRNRGAYNGPHSAAQVQVGAVQEGCHQSFMQSLLSPHLPEQSSHQQVVQCCPPVSMEYCVSRSSSAELQAKASSPSVPQSQKAPGMRLGEGNKGHISQVGSNLHGGVRTALPHPPTPNSSSEVGRSSAPSRPPAAVSQHSRHISRDTQPTKLRPGDRARSGTVRSTNPFESEGHLPLPSGGGVLLGRPQSGGEARRSTIVRFMPDTAQVPSDNNLVPDQHLTQNFGFPFIPEGGMNPPPPINTNSSFIPPVSQPNASRTPSLLPVETQNTLPSFYPSYSPAAHPSLPSDVTLQYFPNQMFSSPSTDKSSAPPLNNRFGSILSPPRPVGFAQASFPLLPDMTPMPPIANSSGITPHISNFSLTSLFPEMATGMAPDGSAMPMSPLLSLSNTSADSGKQGNRPAHNISHILGHDGSSAV